MSWTVGWSHAVNVLTRFAPDVEPDASAVQLNTVPVFVNGPMSNPGKSLAFLTVPVAEPVVLIKGSGVPRIAGGSASVQKVGKLSHAPTTVPMARAWYTMADPAGPVPLSAITGLPGIPPGVPLQS